MNAAFNWYLARSPRAAERFLEAVDGALRAVESAPKRQPVIRGRLRRLLLKGFPYGVYYKVYPEGDQCSRRHSRTTTPSRLAPSRVSANERLLLSAPVTQQKRAALGGRSRVAQREACMKDILRHRWPTTRARTTLVRCTHNFAVAAGVRLCGLAWSCRAAHAKP